MATEKKLTGDLLFGLQVILSWMFTIPLIGKAFAHHGTITWPMFCLIYVLINLFLAIGAYTDKPSRKLWHVMMLYINFTILWFAFLLTCLFRVSWSLEDSEVTVFVLMGIFSILFLRKKESFVQTILDPVTRGWLSFGIKSTLQVYVGYMIVSTKNNTMLPLTGLIAGHITVLMRTAEVYLAARKSGWQLNNKSLFWSELGNEFTWCLTTLAWFKY